MNIIDIYKSLHSDVVFVGDGSYFAFERKNRKREELAQVLSDLIQSKKRIILVEALNPQGPYRVLSGRLHTRIEEDLLLGALRIQYRSNSNSIIILPHKVGGIYVSNMSRVRPSDAIIWSRNSDIWEETIPKALARYEAGTRSSLLMDQNESIRKHNPAQFRCSYYEVDSMPVFIRYMDYLRSRSERKGGPSADEL